MCNRVSDSRVNLGAACNEVNCDVTARLNPSWTSSVGLDQEAAREHAVAQAGPSHWVTRKAFSCESKHTLTVCVFEGASLTDGAAPPKWSETSFCSCRSGRTAAGTATVVARPAKLYGSRKITSWQPGSLSWLYQQGSLVRLPSATRRR